MTIHTIDTGLFKLDGGAMFGVVPKALWQKSSPADENNLCSWAMRCLLVEEGNRLLLIDTGLGEKQDTKFLSHYYLHGEGSLINSIHEAGFSPNDVTDVLLTHLHFDHCGGAIKYTAGRTSLELTFPKATYWSHADHWHWATHPNAREKASFLNENINPISESGHLTFVPNDGSFPHFDMDILMVDGHTEKMMLPKIRYKEHTLIYMADLVPSASHVPIPYVMGYDVRPLLTMEEKTSILGEAAAHGYLLLFEHDPLYECALVENTDKGVRVSKKGKLKDFL